MRIFNQKSSRQSQSGFTIVELLIVIVVIGILAAITIVAFNGVQQRAHDASRQSDLAQARKQIAVYKAQHDSLPNSLDDCPTPAAGNMCLKVSSDDEVSYNEVTSNAYSGAGSWVVPGYEMAIMGENDFVYSLNTEQRGTNEFLRLADIAPYIDRYGLTTYQLSFYLKSEDISNRSQVNVYLQNGGNTRYTFNVGVAATTEYKHYTIEFTPTVSNLSVQQSYLAFYGTYNTGNVPIVKDVTLKKK